MNFPFDSAVSLAFLALVCGAVWSCNIAPSLDTESARMKGCAALCADRGVTSYIQEHQPQGSPLGTPSVPLQCICGSPCGAPAPAPAVGSGLAQEAQGGK